MLRYAKHAVRVVVLVNLSLGMQSSVFASEQEHDVPFSVGESEEQTLTGKVGNGNEETPGEWYAGDAPANPIEDAPVLLFVPGLNNVAQIFWEDNDMYETARDAGYQTAFVQLNDAGGESADMWDNGELLSEKIMEVSEHFDQRKITIIAYSKGGVDTQTALTYYNAADYVDNVITLSSPHHGSELADLAYSSWAEWLVDLIGVTGEGMYSLQTGYMAAFRSDIDKEPLAYENNYYTLGGTDWGSLFSSTWFGGNYLSQYGENDGVVTTASSALPSGEELELGEWDHISIRTGETFSAFENYLLGDQSFAATSTLPDGVKNDLAPTQTRWIHGGLLIKDEHHNTSISVEKNVDHLQLHLLTSEPVDHIYLENARGEKVFPKIKEYQNEEGIFLGAYSYALTIEQPEAGNWELFMEATSDSAYLLVADYDSKSEFLKGGSTELIDNQQFIYHLNMDSSELQTDTIQATYHITQSSDPTNSQTYRTTSQTNLSQQFSVHHAEEVYNITIDIEGLTKEGDVFKRTLVDSVYVD